MCYKCHHHDHVPRLHRPTGRQISASPDTPSNLKILCTCNKGVDRYVTKMRGQRQQDSSREVDVSTPVWEPHVQEFKKLTRSFSRENVAKLPLERVSTTLQDVKRSSESLMLTAHSTIQKIKVGEVGFDGSELPKKKRPEIRTVKDRSTLRRAVSESSIRRPKISRALAESPTRKGGSRKQSNETFEWLSSLGEKIVSNTDPSNKFAFQLPSAAEFQQQVRVV